MTDLNEQQQLNYKLLTLGQAYKECGRLNMFVNAPALHTLLASNNQAVLVMG